MDQFRRRFSIASDLSLCEQVIELRLSSPHLSADGASVGGDCPIFTRAQFQNGKSPVIGFTTIDAQGAGAMKSRVFSPMVIK